MVTRTKPASRLFAIALACFWVTGLLAVEIGTERIMVIHELGRPTYSVAKKNTEILTYAGGVRITLTDGRVSAMAGLKSAAGATVSPAPVPESAADRAVTKAEADDFARMEKAQADADSAARMKMEKAIEEMESNHDHPVRRAPPVFNLKEFAVGVILKAILTLAALKLTCKYWGCEIFWSGLITVSVVDAAIRGAMGLLGTLWLQTPSLFYVDEAIAAGVMVTILRKVSINQSMAQAVQVTMTAKTFSIVVGSLLITVLLRAIA